VMNKGRIEQVDAPYKLYARPRTQFVAGFIGRTNFLEAERQGDQLKFDGGAVAAAGLSDAPAAGPLTLSLRPQSIGLSREKPAATGWAIPGRIVARAYLGEYWDYQVRLGDGGATLRVSTPPFQVHAVEDNVWLDIDPNQVVVLP